MNKIEEVLNQRISRIDLVVDGSTPEDDKEYSFFSNFEVLISDGKVYGIYDHVSYGLISGTIVFLSEDDELEFDEDDVESIVKYVDSKLNGELEVKWNEIEID